MLVKEDFPLKNQQAANILLVCLDGIHDTNSLVVYGRYQTAGAAYLELLNNGATKWGKPSDHIQVMCTEDGTTGYLFVDSCTKYFKDYWKLLQLILRLDDPTGEVYWEYETLSENNSLLSKQRFNATTCEINDTLPMKDLNRSTPFTLGKTIYIPIKKTDRLVEFDELVNNKNITASSVPSYLKKACDLYVDYVEELHYREIIIPDIRLMSAPGKDECYLTVDKWATFIPDYYRALRAYLMSDVENFSEMTIEWVVANARPPILTVVTNVLVSLNKITVEVLDNEY